MSNAPRRLPSLAISEFDKWAAAVFDQSSLGMVRVSPDNKIVACNRTAADIHGLPTLEGMSIPELLPDKKDIDVLQSQAEQRRKGLSTEYEIDVLHFPDRRRVPVKVSGMPLVSPNGEVVGSLAILRPIEVEQRIRAFDDAIHSAKGAAGIFEAVCEQIHELLNFDFSAFSIYSKTGGHISTLFSDDPDHLLGSDRRWYPITGAFAAWVQRQDVQVVDFASFLQDFPEWASDPTVKRFKEAGLVKSLRFPIVRDGRVVAAFSCSTRDPNAFHDDQIQIAKALPIAKAFLMALHSLETEELTFRFNLIRDIFVCRTPEQIARITCEQLASQYSWQSVEIYSIQQASGRIRLLRQNEAPPGYRLDEFYAQPIDKGILGHVFRTGQDVRIDDITSDPDFKDCYLSLGRATRSELCMPIFVNNRISAILNVEDKRANAFCEEEQENLRSVLDEIGRIFGAVWDRALIVNAFEFTPSLVLIADTEHIVIQHNAAAAEKLGYTSAQFTGSKLSDYFEQPDVAERLFESPAVIGIETRLRRKDGSILPVLVGSRELEGFGAWVISARDLTNQKRVAELENLRYIYREIAAQTKTPLSLAYSWIQRLQRKAEQAGSESAAILQKTLAQLNKVDLTYERLALYSQAPGAEISKVILLNATDLLKRIIANIPAETLSAEGLDQTGVYVRGDAFEIEFAVESTISYLQRFLPPDEKITFSVSAADGQLNIRIQGPFPPDPDCSTASAEPVPELVCHAIHEMALGGGIIAKFMQQHRGSFRQERLNCGNLRFQLALPLAHVETLYAFSQFTRTRKCSPRLANS
jgi:PAS domain S-box-containing protein